MMGVRGVLVSVACQLVFAANLFAIGQTRYIANAPSAGSFAIAEPKSAAPICVDPADWPGVIRAARAPAPSWSAPSGAARSSRAW